MQVVLSEGETQLGKILTRLDWEKAVYRPLFTLANTLKNYCLNLKLKGKRYFLLKNILIAKMMKKVFPIKIAVDNLFLH